MCPFFAQEVREPHGYKAWKLKSLWSSERLNCVLGKLQQRSHKPIISRTIIQLLLSHTDGCWKRAGFPGAAAWIWTTSEGFQTRPCPGERCCGRGSACTAEEGASQVRSPQWDEQNLAGKPPSATSSGHLPFPAPIAFPNACSSFGKAQHASPRGWDPPCRAAVEPARQCQSPEGKLVLNRTQGWTEARWSKC